MATKIPTAADLPQVQLNKGRVISAPEINAGAGLSDMGQAAAAVGLSMRDTEEKAEAQDLSNQLSAYSRKLWQGDDESPGYGSLTGKAALDGYSEFETRITKERERLMESATSDRVRSKFSPTADNQVNSTLSKFGTHRMGQANEYEIKTYEAAQAESLQNMVGNSTNPAQARRDGQDIYDSAYQRALKVHGDKDVAMSIAESARSEGHKAVIDDLLERDKAEDAREYYKSVTGELDSTIRAEILSNIEDGSRLQKAQDVSDNIAAKFDLTTADGREAALAEVRNDKSLSAEERKASEDLVVGRINQATSIKALRDSELKTSAIAKLDADGQAKLTPEEMRVLLETTGGANFLEKKRKGEEPTLDPKAWVEFKGHMRDLNDPQNTPMTPEEYHVQYRHRLDDTRYFQGLEELEAIESSRKAAASKSKPIVTSGTLSKNQMMDNALRRTGMIDPTKTGSKLSEADAMRVLRFEELINKKVLSEEAASGKKMEPARVQQIIDETVKDVIVYDKGFWSDDSEIVDIMAPEQIEAFGKDAEIGNIAKFTQDFFKIVDGIRKAQKPVTRENILKVWRTQNP